MGKGKALCIDTLEPLSYVESLLEDVGQYIDFVRTGWGLNYILKEERLKERIDLFHGKGIEVCTGGTAFFIASQLGRVEDFLRYCGRVGFDYIEVAEGVSLLEGVKKCQDYGKFGIMAEVGEKDPDYRFSVKTEEQKVLKLLDMGVDFVVIEGRADGASGIYTRDGDLSLDPVKEIGDRIPWEKVIIEAPRLKQQIYFINQYGPGLNFGNVRLKDAATLESLRRGLKYDTRGMLGEESLWLEE